MDYRGLQQRLQYATDIVGIRAQAICLRTHITEGALSNFKNGKAILSRPAARRLEKYFDNFYLVSL